MKIFNLTTTNPYLNLAIEEYLFLNSSENVFIFWQNEPTVVIGKNQNAYTEVDHNFLNLNGIKVARRITGGGAVYHDFGNLNFSYISVNEKNRSLDFRYFTSIIIEALEKMGIESKLSGRNDILVGDKKISGNAQCTYGSRVLHHGTLLFNSDFSVMASVLRPDRKKIQSKAIKSVAARVANISEFLPELMTLEEFKNSILDFVIEKTRGSLCEIELNNKILALEKRNSSHEWIFPDKDILSKYTFTKSERFSFGIVEVSLLIKNETIIDAKISGDFFELAPISELVEMLQGKNIYKIQDSGEVHPSEFIFGITDKEFFEVFFK